MTQQIKLSELKNVIKEILQDVMGDDTPDGYSNEFQRAHAHSQSTTPRKNETEKAKQLAKAGKYVLLATYPIFCKHTDAILGNETTIEKVFNTREEANAEGEKQSEGSHGDVAYKVIGPEDLMPKKQEPLSPEGDDVPFQETQQQLEGAGWGTTKDIKKDPKHINDPKTGKMERWRIKYASSKDLKKHGNTEKSPVNEGREPEPLTPEAIAGIEKSMQRKGTRPTAKRLVDIALAGHLMGLTSGDLADTATFANGLDAIEQALVQGDFDGAINIAKETAEEMIRDEGGEGILGDEDDLGETVTKNELKEMIRGLVNEMWVI